MSQINRDKLKSAYKKELKLFNSSHKKSKKLFLQSSKNLLGGVPMPWMLRWAGGFPIFVKYAKGAHFTDVDGNKYVDFCLGDTGSMVGHSPEKIIKKISKQLQNGITCMLPTEDAIFIGKELEKRFGLKFWQFATSATDANRFSIRLARKITGRNKILAFNQCYHGTVDETLAVLENGKTISKPGAIGPPIDPKETTKIIEFNNLIELEKSLATKKIAVVIMEPVMTNVGIIHPILGFHKKLRELTKKYGTLLLIDETHTISAGPGGYTKLKNLKPDIIVIGKSIASGIPAAVYGLNKEIAKKFLSQVSKNDIDVSGLGGTLAGNILTLTAMRATLSESLNEKYFKYTIPLANKWALGVKSVIKKYKLPWSVSTLGCRAEYRFTKNPPLNGGESAASTDFDIENFLHLYAINRGILLTPFHNMALMCIETNPSDIKKHTKVFKDAISLIV